MSSILLTLRLAGAISLFTVRHVVGLDDQAEPAGVCGIPGSGRPLTMCWPFMTSVARIAAQRECKRALLPSVMPCS